MRYISFLTAFNLAWMSFWELCLCKLKCLFFLLKADAAFLLENTCPVYSEIGSAKHQKEVNIMNFLQDYLQEIEDSGMF